MSNELLQEVINDFEIATLNRFFRAKNTSAYRPNEVDLSEYDDDCFSDIQQIGSFAFSDIERLIVVTASVAGALSERSSKKAQYDLAKKILRELEEYEAGIFIYCDTNGNFRFSLIHPQYQGTKVIWNHFKRYTYFVSDNLANKTFQVQVGNCNFESIDSIKEAFSLSKVTKEFYRDFFPIFQKVADSIVSKDGTQVSVEVREDFALLFIIRIVFLGFIQKKGWLGGSDRFIQSIAEEYDSQYSGEDKFYLRWLSPLFFEALNSPYGQKVAYQNNEFSKELEEQLQLAPYLNGGLFVEKDIDQLGYFIPDNAITECFNFLFSYNFTIEENTLYDEELELNPEFLGVIFERLVNKADGAVYTPRTEVDYMCRISLVKWLIKNNTTDIATRDLYELFFIEGGTGDEYSCDQKHGSFSENQYRDILSQLEHVAICDPAVGSGAFPVGMLHVLDEIEQHIQDKLKSDSQSVFERKMRIISNSLYGVEVKEWAVWITQLRLWITLFIDAPDELKQSTVPILPSLDFKVRQGDSLVQIVGGKMFPVSGHAMVSQSIKRKVTALKNLKAEFFNNHNSYKAEEIKHREFQIYRDILDDEIKNYKDQINKLNSEKTVIQSSLFGEGAFGVDDKEQIQTKLDFNKSQIVELEGNINELRQQKQSLVKNKPLVWNIEFAEIFVERGGFDIIIGNPPYVRQENIADPLNLITDNKEYKSKLREMVRADFPKHFTPKTKINAKSDLYTYFYIRSLRLLNNGGIHTFICSHSWLDVGYGVWLQKFFLDNAPIEFIIGNHAKRSFGEVSVNTIITVIDAPRHKVDTMNLPRFSGHIEKIELTSIRRCVYVEKASSV